jgi:aspartate dehydrogenase
MTASSRKKPVGRRRVAIAGLGAIGKKTAEALDLGIDGLILAAVSAQTPEKHGNWLGTLRSRPLVLPIEELSGAANIVVECAPAKFARPIVEPFVRSGKTAIVLSAGALLENEDLIELARQNGGQIAVPTGALIGLDAVTAAAVGEIHSVRMVTRKPVRGLAGAPYLVEHNIDIDGIKRPLKIFDGTAREAAKGFPANLNVAVALSLAGIGPDRTRLEIWADPALTRNVHRVEVESDAARFSMSIENIPSENPRTGRITALSVIAFLRKQFAPLRVGT